MSLDAADENKGVLLRKQSVPRWKEQNQIYDNQTGDGFRGRQRARSRVSVDMGWLAPMLALPVLWLGLRGPQSCTGAVPAEQQTPKAC